MANACRQGYRKLFAADCKTLVAMFPAVCRTIMATNGERSSIPIVGSMRRKGDRIGSVMSRRNLEMTMSLQGGTNHENIARRKIALVKTCTRRLTNWDA